MDAMVRQAIRSRTEVRRVVNEEPLTGETRQEPRIAKIDDHIRALQDVVLRLDTTSKFSIDAAKDSAKVIIAEKQIELIKEIEKLRWEFRHF
jgi:hypothetical protein